MSTNSKIEWTDHTFNPWIGCTKVSQEVTGGGGCDGCYAEVSTPVRVLRGKGIETWGAHAPRHRTSQANWALPRRWNDQHDAFFAQHGRRQRVFCASLADVFDNAVDPEWRRDLFALIAATPNLDWLLLTKRIGNAEGMIAQALCEHDVAGGPEQLPEWPWSNIWLGATVVNQAEADRDIPKLLAVPASVRFLSMEPLLGPVDLRVIDVNGHGEIYPLRGTTNCEDDDGDPQPDLPRIDWVIVGGESGPNARAMHPDWATALRDQCQAVDVPFLFKQWGEWKPICQMNEPEHVALYRSRVKARDGEDQGNVDDCHGRVCTVETRVQQNNGAIFDIPTAMAFQQGTGAMQIFRVGKSTAGRLLDGREWNEVPQ